MAEEEVGGDGTADELSEFFAKKSRAKKGKKKKANVRLEDLAEELEMQAAQKEIEEDPQLALMLHRLDMQGEKASPEEKPKESQPVVMKQWAQHVTMNAPVEEGRYVPSRSAQKSLDIADTKIFPSIGDALRVEEIQKREAKKAQEEADKAQEEARRGPEIYRPTRRAAVVEGDGPPPPGQQAAVVEGTQKREADKAQEEADEAGGEDGPYRPRRRAAVAKGDGPSRPSQRAAVVKGDVEKGDKYVPPARRG